MNLILAIAILCLGLATLFVCVVYVTQVVVLRKPSRANPVLTWFASHALILTGIVALCSILGSNYYSEIAKYAPCKLCWWQRILFFPQSLILLIAFWKNDRNALRYVFVLSVLGALLSGYHYYGQMINPSSLPCNAMIIAEACGYIPFAIFGFITVPFMAFIAFCSNAILSGIGISSYMSRSK